MTSRTRRAPSKLNLTLRVGPRRSDGYHDVASLVVWIDLCDELHLTPRSDGVITLTCNDPSLPIDENNLVVRAARIYREYAQLPTLGADLLLTKNIPIGAGLGGGSSDAATTLHMLNDYVDEPMHLDALMEIAAKLGSDVPLFLCEPWCIAHGRGERITLVETNWSPWAVLALPSIHSSTPAVYASFDAGPPPPVRPEVGEALPALDDADAMMRCAFNDLEEAAFAVNPALREVFDRVAHATGAPMRMSGSGSAGYRLFDAEGGALRYAEQARAASGVRVEVVRAGAVVAHRLNGAS